MVHMFFVCGRVYAMIMCNYIMQILTNILCTVDPTGCYGGKVNSLCGCICYDGLFEGLICTGMYVLVF